MIKNTFKKRNNKSEQFKFIRTLIDRKFNGAIEGEFRYYNDNGAVYEFTMNL